MTNSAHPDMTAPSACILQLRPNRTGKNYKSMD
jgi:hypothetical protein